MVMSEMSYVVFPLPVQGNSTVASPGAMECADGGAGRGDASGGVHARSAVDRAIDFVAAVATDEATACERRGLLRRTEIKVGAHS
jgi:hypothetical protein